MTAAAQPAEALYVLTTVSPSGEVKRWAPLPLKAAESIAQSKRDRGHETRIDPA